MHLYNLTTTDSYILHFENISRSISIYISIFYIIFGNIGNLLKILFFIQKPLRSCPCSIYVLMATVSHFFTLNNIPISNLSSHIWMTFGFGWSDSTNHTIIESLSLHSEYSIKLCKIRNYFHMWSSNFSFQVLLFASINRFCFCLTKKNRRRKQRYHDFFCSISIAYFICSIACIIWALISVHHISNFNIMYNICSPQNTFSWAIEICSIYFLQSILIILFGILTILHRQERAIWIPRRCKNHHEMIPMFNQLCQQCRKERSERHHVETQLTSMIVTEIILVVLSTLPYSIYIAYRLVTLRNERTPAQMMYQNIVERLIRLTIFFEPSCGFYIYIFSLTTLKKRFLYVVRRKIGIL